jgi:myb proto-oncogene protein
VQEDALLKALICKHGARNWSVIAHGIHGRSGKSCRLRWCNQLNPCVKKEPFSEDEDAKIIAVRNTPNLKAWRTALAHQF